MTYYESAAGIMLTRRQTQRLIQVTHQSSWAMFIQDYDENGERHGSRMVYPAQMVLRWLGY